MTGGETLVLFLGALVGALVMTSLMAAGRMLGLSRMSIPFLLGTLVTPNRDRAIPLGLAMHVAVAMLLSLVYYGLFRVFGQCNWWFGALVGLGHGLVIHVLLMPALPGMHPRMASERDGPEPTRALEPPGPLGLNYGLQTPLVGLVAHVVFGIVLGIFCQAGRV